MNEKIDLEQIEGSEGFGFPLSNLATANKSSLVGAINEIHSSSIRGSSYYLNKTMYGRGSYVHFVIPLFEYVAFSTATLDSYFFGEITFNRNNGNGSFRHIAKIYGGHSYNNNPTASYESNTIGTDLVTFTYNGKKYVGIRWQGGSDYTQFDVGAFVSTNNRNAIEVIGFYNQNTLAVLNAEIKDSVQQYIPPSNVDSYNKKYMSEHLIANEAALLTLERVNNVNTAIRFINQSKELTLGTNDGDNFIIGDNGDLNNPIYRWFRVNRDGTIYSKSHGNSGQWNTAFNWGRGIKVDGNSIAVHNLQTIDTNDIKNASVWAAGANRPNNINSAVVSFNPYISGSSNYGLQIAGRANNFSFRTLNDNVYTEWKDIFHTGNFNPASYVLQTSLNSQLGNYATKAGTQSFTGQNTFTVTPIVPNGTLDGHTVNLGQLNTLLVAKADVRLSNLVSDLSTTEKATIKNKLGVIDTTYTNGTGLDLTNNVFSITIAIQNSISKGFTAYGWGNHASAGYALSSQLANYVPVNGAFTINGTKTFSSSPVVPNATLSSHAVNLGQVYNIVNNVIISNDIVELDLLITDEFQSILDNIPQIGIEYAKCYYRNKTLGVAITIKNSSSSPVDVFGSSTSIVSLFTLPDEIMYRINQSIRDLIPQFKLQNSDPVSSYSSYQTFVELEGTIKHPYGLLLSENYKTVIYGEFECLDMV